jgi:hypothetical protein
MHIVQHDNYTISTPQFFLQSNVARARWKDDLECHKKHENY